MKKHYIQLPREHISYSQVSLFKSDPKRYAELYFNNDKSFALNNSGLSYGKVFAESLEHEVETGDLLTDAALLLIPKMDVRDKEIAIEIKTDSGWLKIIGRPDMLDSVSKNFLEVKTGKIKWTQNKAQKHPQMIFYAMLIYLAYGVVLKDAQLVWIQTEEVITPHSPLDWLPEDRKVIKPTGHVETFKVEFTLKDILNCLAETIRVAKEIELEFAAH